MLEHTRSSGLWFYILDPDKNQQINVRLSAVRQEITGPLSDPVVVVSFGSYTASYKGSVVPPTEADAGKCVPFVTADDDSEIIMLFELGVGANPALLFERIATVVTEVLLGQHRPMGYKAYTAFQKGRPHATPGSLFVEDERSPTGRIAVWDVTFARTYDVDKNGLFAILTEQAKYRAGWMSCTESKPGSCYNLPANFWLRANVSGTSYLEVLSNLLEYVKDSSDLANTEDYWVKQ